MEPITEHFENAAINAIAAKYGPYLGKLTNAQKLELMGLLSLWIGHAIDDEDDDEDDDEEVHWSELYFGFEPEGAVEDILNQCDDLAPDEALVFITSIANTVSV
jgi:hypothetical protein